MPEHTNAGNFRSRISNRSGLHIADAKQATGQLITEIQIGQRMLGIIESSARYAKGPPSSQSASEAQLHAVGGRDAVVRT